MPDVLASLAETMVLGAALDRVRALAGGWDLIDHWTQGEFHHDLVLRVNRRGSLPGDILVIATNCNGGVKEVLAFDEVPPRSSLWHWRCPDNPEFDGELPPLRGRATTPHYFDPCELLTPDARSEIRPEFRERQPGGGWRHAGGACSAKK